MDETESTIITGTSPSYPPIPWLLIRSCSWTATRVSFCCESQLLHLFYKE